MKKRQTSISPVERAIIAQKWHQNTVTAQIHALMGDDSHAMVNQAGRTFYVVLGAAMTEGLSPDQVEIRIIRGAVNAVHDQAGVEAIPSDRRASIVRGLQAAIDLIPLLARKALVDSACQLALMLRAGDVWTTDFDKLTQPGA